MRRYKLFILLSLCLYVFHSCGVKDLSDENFIDFAMKIEKEIMNYENENPIIYAFDYEEFEKRVLTGLEISKKDRNRASKFIREHTKPAVSIMESVKNGANFRFVKFYRNGNEPHVIFRTYFNGGVSLEDWTLGVKKGQIRIYDAFAIVSGINWSDDCRQKLCNYLDFITDEVFRINNLIEVNYFISNEEYDTADSLLYWILPQKYDDLYARTMELNLASLNKSYENVQFLAENFEKTFPSQRAIYTFYLMQSSIRHGLADETTTHIHALISLIGDDPIYYVYQSWSYQYANANVYALQMLDSAIRYMPHIFDLYLNKLDIYYSDYDYQSCVNLLYEMDTLFESGGEGDAVFFKLNYPQLIGYEPFIKWIQSKGKTT